MTVKVFFGERSRFEHEYEQLEEIYTTLSEIELENSIYMLTTFIAADAEIDCLILTKYGMVILELKSFKGIVNIVENGDCSVTDNSGKDNSFPNILKQLRKEKFAVFEKLKPLLRTSMSHIEENDFIKIKCWGYFKKGSSYNPDQLDQRYRIWFDIITANELLNKMNYVRAGYILREKDMVSIVKRFNLTDCTVEFERNIKEQEMINMDKEEYSDIGISDDEILVQFKGNCPKNVAKDAKYSIKSDEGEDKIGIVYKSNEGEMWYPVTDEHQVLVEMVNRIKLAAVNSPRGSFYINEYKQVIIPVSGNRIYYLGGEYSDPLEFEFEGKTLSGDAKDHNGNPLSPGDEWIGPHPGIKYILAGNGQDIYYEIEPRPKVRKRVNLSDFQPNNVVGKLCQLIQKFKPSGGRFYINEFKQIFAPIQSDQLRYIYIGKLENLNEWFPKFEG